MTVKSLGSKHEIETRQAIGGGYRYYPKYFKQGVWQYYTDRLPGGGQLWFAQYGQAYNHIQRSRGKPTLTLSK